MPCLTAAKQLLNSCRAALFFRIQYLLKTKFDWPFTLAYVASYMLVSLGIFNVILAVPWI